MYCVCLCGNRRLKGACRSCERGYTVLWVFGESKRVIFFYIYLAGVTVVYFCADRKTTILWYTRTFCHVTNDYYIILYYMCTYCKNKNRKLRNSLFIHHHYHHHRSPVSHIEMYNVIIVHASSIQMYLYSRQYYYMYRCT